MIQRTADCRSWQGKCAALFTDFSAAYDKVIIPALLHKLTELKANVPLVSWLKGYLCDRRARGKRLNCVGQSYVLASGLPQGSSPSTLLWNIYTHDLDFSIPDNNGCGANLVQTGFADDQSFHAIGGSWEEVFELLPAAATKLENYCNICRIQLNAKKCQLLFFGR